MNNPKVSAIIPFYNGVNWLCEAVQSVLDQTYKNIEIIVVNDGSPEDISLFLDIYGDRVNYFYQNNQGPAAARNLAIANATGDYYALLDSDDVWLPNKTEEQIRFMEESGCMWSHTAYYYWWPDNGKLKTFDIHKNYGWVLNRLFVSFRISTPSVIINSKCFKEHPEFSFPKHMRYAQDLGLFKQIAKYYPIGLLDIPLMQIRMRGTNTNSRALVRIRVNTAEYYRIKNSDINSGASAMAKIILGLYVINGKITNFLLSQLQFKESVVEFIAKCLWFFPYVIERIYTLFLTQNNKLNNHLYRK